MTANPLTISEMRNYGETHHFSNDLEFFIRVMSEMDDKHLEWFHDKQEQEVKKQEAEREKRKEEERRKRRFT